MLNFLAVDTNYKIGDRVHFTPWKESVGTVVKVLLPAEGDSVYWYDVKLDEGMLVTTCESLLVSVK